MTETNKLEIDLYDYTQNGEISVDVREDIIALVHSVVSDYGDHPTEVDEAYLTYEAAVELMPVQDHSDYTLAVSLPASESRENYMWPTCRDLKYMTARLLQTEPSKVHVRYRLYSEAYS